MRICPCHGISRMRGKRESPCCARERAIGLGRLLTVHDILDDLEHRLWVTGAWSKEGVGETKVCMGLKR